MVTVVAFLVEITCMLKFSISTFWLDVESDLLMLIVFSEESATISYRLGIGMIPDDEDTRDYDDTNDSSLQPVTDLTGVGEPSNDEEGIPSQTTTDISSMLEQDSNQEVK